MTPSDTEVQRRLAEARQGSAEALAELLDAYRAYLLLLAQRELDPAIRAKGGASDLVQQTFLEAVRDFNGFRGETEPELLAWLRRILMHNVASFTRQFRDTAKRRLANEVSLTPNTLTGPAPAAVTPSPLQEAIDQEQARLVREAVQRLPDDYQRVIHLRYHEGFSFEQIGESLQRTANAARKLWLRAVERLQEEMGTTPE